MDFEPQKFFIGLIDFFSIWLPGAVLTYLALKTGTLVSLGVTHFEFVGAEDWMVFFFSSYLLGHFVFLVGSCMDDLVYDKLRRLTLNYQYWSLARTKMLIPKWKRRIVKLIFKNERNIAVQRVVEIKKKYLHQLLANDAVNAFQWSKARLAAEDTDALTHVQRFEADSKFFRSFVIVLLVIPFIGHLHLLNIVIMLILLPLAFWRYLEQRYKATNQAYWYVIALEGQNGKMRINLHQRGDAPTHAGGIVYRSTVNGQVELLLVEAKESSDKRVLPKGHIEFGEMPEETAIREVYEESGVWTKIIGTLDVQSYIDRGEAVRVQYYLMEALEEEKPLESDRNPMWYSIDDVEKKAITELTPLLSKTKEKIPK